VAVAAARLVEAVAVAVEEAVEAVDADENDRLPPRA
jgi:hypothetical protein